MSTINKEWWVSVRDDTNWNMDVYYNFYMDTKPYNYINLTLEEFSKIFPYFMRYYGSIIEGTEKPKSLNPESIINKIYKHFDNKFK